MATQSGARPAGVTITQVAAEAGVSIATVSRVLNDQKVVSETTRQRVQEVAARLHYVPHGAARSLITRRTRTIGVILPDIHGEFFSELIRGMDTVCRGSGYHLLLSGFHSDPNDLAEILQMTRGRVDGLVVMWPQVDAEALRAALPDSLPVVLLNCRLDDTPCDCIEVDNAGGAREVALRLLQLGHRRIAVVGGPESNRDARDRVNAFRAAVSELGGRGATLRPLEGDFTEKSGYRAGLRLLALKPRPTAVFAANDSMALGLLRALREGGVAVPEEMALVGFDDIPTVRYVSPPLSSVTLFVADLGRRAVECLLDHVERPDEHVPVVERRPARLVIRESCGGPLRSATRVARQRLKQPGAGSPEREVKVQVDATETSSNE